MKDTQSRRDDFTEATKRILAARVGHHCSNPTCRRHTSGPSDDPKGKVNVGEAAHITGASPGGPRYDPNLLPEERSAPGNGVWLCANCATMVDRDEGRYTPAVLHGWKVAAE